MTRMSPLVFVRRTYPDCPPMHIGQCGPVCKNETGTSTIPRTPLDNVLFVPNKIAIYANVRTSSDRVTVVSLDTFTVSLNSVFKNVFGGFILLVAKMFSA